MVAAATPSAARAGRGLRQRDPRALGRQDWIDAARRMLIARGVERLRVDGLARTLRITRGSFYWHFAGRKALLDAVLDDWRVRNTAPFLAVAEDGRGFAEPDAAVRLRLHEQVVADVGGAARDAEHVAQAEIERPMAEGGVHARRLYGARIDLPRRTVR